MKEAVRTEVAAGSTSRLFVRRFGLWNRLTHGVLAASVLGLVFTGMPLKYSGAFWAEPLMRLWGGARTAGVAHRVFAVGFFAAAAMHVGWLAAAAITHRLPKITDPDSIVPGRADLQHIREYLRYLRGHRPRPDFGRYTYWEKFDYFGEIWGLLVIGLSGLVMWFPERAALYLPGWVVNASLIFHSYEALLAMAFLFAIHFFNTHLRPDAFPVDRVIFSGDLPLEEVQERYPGWYRRLVAGGHPSVLRAGAPVRERRGPAVVSVIFLTLGLVMLALVMSTALGELIGMLGRMAR